MKIKINEENEEPVYVFIKQLVCTVREVEETAHGLLATLGSGEKVVCPPGTKVSDLVVVDPHSRAFVSKTS